MDHIRSKKQQEQDDLELAKTLKPTLRKFLGDAQTTAAAKAHAEQLQKAEELFADSHATRHAAQLAMITLLDRKLWRL